MIKHLWINGDSNTAGTYHKPISDPFAKQLADEFNLTYTNIALPGGSNQRIIRTTVEALPTLDPANTFLLIGWSNDFRTEWYWNNNWHAICGDPGYDIPEFVKQNWNWVNCENPEIWKFWTVINKEHEHDIYVFHKLLHQLGYKFLFYMTCLNVHFYSEIFKNFSTKLSWLPGTWAHDPYDKNTGFSNYSIAQGHVQDEWWHFGQEAHNDWAKFLSPIMKSKML